MRKVISVFLFCFLLQGAFPLSAYAANRVPAMEVQAVLSEDGSLYVTQVWQGDFDEGTEVYIPMDIPETVTVSALTVSDQNGVYQTLQNWSVDRSFEEKARKCGIHETNSGFEICFGISQYGQNRYTIAYKLNNAVCGYSDRDGVNFRFVNDQMNTTPTDVVVEIRLADGTPITDEIADVWGFGFEGKVGFSNGGIVAYTDTPLTAENHVTVLFSLEKGILSPVRQDSGSFEEAKEAAFSGSDYDTTGEEVSAFEAFMAVLLSVVLPIGLLIWFGRLRKKKAEKKRRQFSERFGYFREIPKRSSSGLKHKDYESNCNHNINGMLRTGKWDTV